MIVKASTWTTSCNLQRNYELCILSSKELTQDFVCLTLWIVLGYYQLSIGKLGKRLFKDCWDSWSWRWICSNGLCHLRDRCCHGSKSNRWRGPLCQGDVPEGKEILPLCSQVFYLLLICQCDVSSFSASRSINSWTCVLPLYSLFHLLFHVHIRYSVILFSLSDRFLCLAFSYLRYGLLAARAEVLKASDDAENPCILSGYDGKYTSFMYVWCYFDAKLHFSFVV